MLNRAIKRFWDDRRGYVIALTLIAMPLLLGFSLIVIDIGRSANLHTDLQNAVDAMALAGARELDGRDNAIERARDAIEKLSNTAAFGNGGEGMSLGSYIAVSYNAANDDLSTVTVRFLKGIPGDGTFEGDDDDPITEAMVTTDSNEAGYAWVTAKDQAMQTIFPLPVGLNRNTIIVSADAVAAYRVSACDVTPIFICNPYEPAGNTSAAVSEEKAEELHDRFAAGDLYGVQIELHSTSSSNPGPGNFGFLRTPLGNGANVLAEALATGNPGTCYTQDNLDTETGAKAGPIEDGVNTRFGFYGSIGNTTDPSYRPAKNVRAAQEISGNGNGNGNGNASKSCSAYTPVMSSDGTQVGDPTKAVPLGYGADMSAMGGGKISGSNDWNYVNYWNVAHPGISRPSVTDVPSSYPGSGASAPGQPSAYDVYRYELNNPLRINDASPNGDTGAPTTGKGCYAGTYPEDEEGDRREIFSAIVNCGYEASVGHLNGHKATEAVAFARMFLTKPAIKAGSERYLSLELIDITGRGGRGTLDEFLREEAELVR